MSTTRTAEDARFRPEPGDTCTSRAHGVKTTVDSVYGDRLIVNLFVPEDSDGPSTGFTVNISLNTWRDDEDDDWVWAPGVEEFPEENDRTA